MWSEQWQFLGDKGCIFNLISKLAFRPEGGRRLPGGSQEGGAGWLGWFDLKKIGGTLMIIDDHWCDMRKISGTCPRIHFMTSKGDFDRPRGLQCSCKREPPTSDSNPRLAPTTPWPQARDKPAEAWKRSDLFGEGSTSAATCWNYIRISEYPCFAAWNFTFFREIKHGLQIQECTERLSFFLSLKQTGSGAERPVSFANCGR